MSKFNFLFGLLGKAIKSKNVSDIPQLTNFLKSSEVFKSFAWRIHDLKNKTIDKLDEQAFKDDPQNNPKYNQQKNNKKR